MNNCPQTGDSLAAWESSITCLTSTSKTRKGVTGPKHSLDSVPQSCSSHHWTPVFFGSPHCPEPFRWILEFFPAPHLRWVMVFVTRKMFRVLLSPMSSQSRKDWEHSIRYRHTKSAYLFIYLFIIIIFFFFECRFRSWLPGTGYTSSFGNEVKPIYLQMVPNQKKKKHRVMENFQASYGHLSHLTGTLIPEMLGISILEFSHVVVPYLWTLSFKGKTFYSRIHKPIKIHTSKSKIITPSPLLSNNITFSSLHYFI